MQEGVDVNNRVVQPLYGRAVRVSTNGAQMISEVQVPPMQPSPLTAVLGLLAVAATALIFVANCGAMKARITTADQQRREARAGRTPASRGFFELA